MEEYVVVIHREMEAGNKAEADRILTEYGDYRERMERERCLKVIRGYSPDEGLSPLTLSERMTLELVERKIEEVSNATG